MTIDVTFFPAGNSSGSQLGYGSLKIHGISINYTVFRSPRSDSGIFVSLPSRKKIVNGQQVMKDGKPEYVNEVFMERETRAEIDELIKNSMYNRGITVDATTTTSIPSHSFSSPTNSENKPSSSPPKQESYDLTRQSQVVSDNEDDELPF